MAVLFEFRFNVLCDVASTLHRLRKLFLAHAKLLTPIANLVFLVHVDAASVARTPLRCIVCHLRLKNCRTDASVGATRQCVYHPAPANGVRPEMTATLIEHTCNAG